MQGGTESQVPKMFFKSGKYNSSPYQIEENNKKDNAFNKTMRNYRAKSKKEK